MMKYRDMKLYQINQAVKRYSHEMYAIRENGRILILRKRKAFKPIEYDGNTILISQDNPEYVLALTNNWSTSGVPVDWGQDSVLAKLKKLDWWENQRLMDEIEDNNLKVRESNRRSFKTKLEGVAEEWRPVFKKATADINVSALDKTDPRKIKEQKLESNYVNNK